jgi:hypothetical protein
VPEQALRDESYKRLDDRIQALRRHEDAEGIDKEKYDAFLRALNPWYEHRAQLAIILSRYGEAFVIYEKAHIAFFAAVNRGEKPDREHVAAVFDSYSTLALEIKSFYLFSKILLDRIADAISRFVGIPKKTKGSSHQWIIRGFYHTSKGMGLDISPTFKKYVDTLLKRVIDYRDDLIEYPDDASLLTTITVASEGHFSLSTSTAPGTPPPSPGKTSENPRVLLREIDDYLMETIDFFERNLSKSALRAPRKRAT